MFSVLSGVDNFAYIEFYPHFRYLSTSKLFATFLCKVSKECFVNYFFHFFCGGNLVFFTDFLPFSLFCRPHFPKFYLCRFSVFFDKKHSSTVVTYFRFRKSLFLCRKRPQNLPGKCKRTRVSLLPPSVLRRRRRNSLSSLDCFYSIYSFELYLIIPIAISSFTAIRKRSPSIPRIRGTEVSRLKVPLFSFFIPIRKMVS